MNYDKMSDLEINNEVECALDERVGFLEYDEVNDEFVGCDPVGDNYFRFKARNFCNNPSDAWPIIVESKISINFRVTSGKLKPMAFYGDDTIYHVHENPLRAAMIVYLMMQETK